MNQFNEHLTALREQVLRGKDFAAILKFYFDHCAEHPEFIELGERVRQKELEELLPKLLATACQEPLAVRNLILIHITEAKFIHGTFLAAYRPGSLIYFQDIGAGVAALARRDGSGTDFARFTCYTA